LKYLFSRVDAIVSYQGKEFVFVVTGDRQFEMTEVKTGTAENGYTATCSRIGYTYSFPSECILSFDHMHRPAVLKEVQKTIRRVILLLLDILVFTYDILRKVILPTRRRKGNILSSLLSFFVGLVDRVLSFEKSILPQPVVLKQRYVKQALMIAVGFLFLLSSLEWSVEQRPVVISDETPAIVVDEIKADTTQVLSPAQLHSPVRITLVSLFTPALASSETFFLLSGGTFTVRRYVRYRNFRI
jgi:hypothetical protein